MFPNLSEDKQLVIKSLDKLAQESDILLGELPFEDRLKVNLKYPFEIYELSNRLALAMTPEVGKAHEEALTKALERYYYIKNLHVERKSKKVTDSKTVGVTSESMTPSDKATIKITPALAMMMWNPSLFGLPKLGVPYAMAGGNISGANENRLFINFFKKMLPNNVELLIDFINKVNESIEIEMKSLSPQQKQLLNDTYYYDPYARMNLLEMLNPNIDIEHLKHLLNISVNKFIHVKEVQGKQIISPNTSSKDSDAKRLTIGVKEAQEAAEEASRMAEEASRMADEAEQKTLLDKKPKLILLAKALRQRAEEARKRLAETEARRLEAEEQARRLEAEEQARRLETEEQARRLAAANIEQLKSKVITYGELNYKLSDLYDGKMVSDTIVIDDASSDRINQIKIEITRKFMEYMKNQLENLRRKMLEILLDIANNESRTGDRKQFIGELKHKVQTELSKGYTPPDLWTVVVDVAYNRVPSDKAFQEKYNEFLERFINFNVSKNKFYRIFYPTKVLGQYKWSVSEEIKDKITKRGNNYVSLTFKGRKTDSNIKYNDVEIHQTGGDNYRFSFEFVIEFSGEGKELTPLVGGSILNNSDIMYKTKYLKYKQKYLSLKKKLT